MSNCSHCQKLILEPGVSYGINPNAVCHCARPDSNTDTKIRTILADFGGKVLADQMTTTKRIDPAHQAIKALLASQVAAARIEAAEDLDRVILLAATKSTHDTLPIVKASDSYVKKLKADLTNTNNTAQGEKE